MVRPKVSVECAPEPSPESSMVGWHAATRHADAPALAGDGAAVVAAEDGDRQ